MKYQNPLLLLAVLVQLALVGCSGDDFPKYNELASLRVITLITSTPEVNAGSTVTITPWISDVTGAGRALTYSATACLDPGVGYGADPSCDSVPGKVTIATNSSVTSTLNAANVFTAAADTFNVTVPLSAIIFAGRTARDQYNGVNYLVVYSLQSNDGVVVKSFKRIVVSTKAAADLNTNPTFTDILRGGSSLSALPTGEVTLEVSYPASSLQAYPQMGTDGTVTTLIESLTITWFISDGKMKYQRTVNSDINTYTAASSLGNGRTKALFLGLMRDGRGGAAVISKAL